MKATRWFVFNYLKLRPKKPSWVKTRCQSIDLCQINDNAATSFITVCTTINKRLSGSQPDTHYLCHSLKQFLSPSGRHWSGSSMVWETFSSPGGHVCISVNLRGLSGQDLWKGPQEPDQLICLTQW
ncbi:hypothetical protein GOODEAATRI_034609 [Goodea atripinnis]|uniref:Uncharacterized protein n=1 Tax=Goodea atripinnis TaxID=208336 RepID=A0ABV0PUT0_9TELE